MKETHANREIIDVARINFKLCLRGGRIESGHANNITIFAVQSYLEVAHHC
jgi:hypothetical protein